MAEVTMTPSLARGWKQFYEWTLVASWDTATFDSLDAIVKFALQVWAMPADEIKVYASLYNTWNERVQLFNTAWTNPVAQNKIVQEDISTYRRVKIEKTGASDTVTIAVCLTSHKIF
jgi:hypothetical protein